MRLTTTFAKTKTKSLTKCLMPSCIFESGLAMAANISFFNLFKMKSFWDWEWQMPKYPVELMTVSQQSSPAPGERSMTERPQKAWTRESVTILGSWWKQIG